MAGSALRAGPFAPGAACKGQWSPLQASLSLGLPGALLRPAGAATGAQRMSRGQTPGTIMPRTWHHLPLQLSTRCSCSHSSVDILDPPCSTFDQSEAAKDSFPAPATSSSSDTGNRSTSRGSSTRATGYPSSSGGSIDHLTLQEIQAATTGKLAELQHVVEEVGPGLGEDATLQLEEVSSTRLTSAGKIFMSWLLTVLLLDQVGLML